MIALIQADGEALSTSIDAFFSKNSHLDDSFEPLYNDPDLLASFISAAANDGTELFDTTDMIRTGKATAIHIKNAFLPPDNMCDTPLDFIPVPNEAGTLRAQLSAMVLLALAGGRSISYMSENSGALFVNLTTIPGVGRKEEKSKKSMRGHTDAVSFPFPGPYKDTLYPDISPAPDILCLVCLRNPDKTHTRLIPLDDVIEKLEPETIQELQKEQFTIECQNTFRKGTRNIIGEVHFAYDANILQKNEDNNYMVRYSHSKAAADHDNIPALKALEKFQNAIRDSIIKVKLEPGDVIILNNRRALHGKDKHSENYGLQTRWLLRSYGFFNDNLREDFFYKNSKYMLYP